MYKVGVTERGDAGLDFSWEDKLDKVDMAILITKNCNDKFREAVSRHKDKVMVHATVTGHGGSIVEPNVPPLEKSIEYITALANILPKEKIVIRTDPIIPIRNGVKTAGRVMTEFAERGFKRFRVSIIDMYPHVRARFREAGLPLPYGEGFCPSSRQIAEVDRMLCYLKNKYPHLSIESCAEVGLTEAVARGCVSPWDLSLFNLYDVSMSTSYQRPECRCYGGKTELLKNKCQCPHGCLYCYWK